MLIFSTLLLKIIPFYLLIAIGFVAGKFLKTEKETIASLLIYIVAPIVIFNGATIKPITLRELTIPFLIFSIASIIAISAFNLLKHKWKDATPNIIGFASGAGNTGYFGLPVAILLFGQEAMQISVLVIMSTVLFESTVGFYITARGKHTPMMSLKKLIKLPTIHAFILGLIFNFCGYHQSQIASDFFNLFKGAYTILGMMIIGLALQNVKNIKFDFKFLFSILTARYILWPITMGVIVALDKNFFHFYTPLIRNVFLLTAVIPVAANTVVFATELKVLPEKAAVAVFLSALISLFYIPLFFVCLS